MLTAIAIAIGLYIAYRRIRSSWQWNRSPDAAGQKLQLAPANVTAIIAILLVIPGFWVLSVEGWKETTTFDLQTGQETTSSTFGSQFAHAMVYFALAGALLFAAKIMRDKRIEWPPTIQQPLQRSGLVPPVVSHPAPAGSIDAVGEPQAQAHFLVPPGWPVPPPGWTPPEGWTPDPEWPPAPEGWQFWSHRPAGQN
jgi:hypothetical protein